MKKKLGYILRIMHIPFTMLLANPVVLSYSLRRIGSRLEYVRSRVPILLEEYSLPFWIQPVDEVFVHRRLFQGTLYEYLEFKDKWTISFSGDQTQRIMGQQNNER